MKAAKYTANGKTLSLVRWEQESGIPEKTLWWRVNRMGLTMEQALARGITPHGAAPKHFTTYHGKRVSFAELSRGTGIVYQTIKHRILVMGMTGDEAAARSGFTGELKPGVVAKPLRMRKKYANECRYHDNCDTCPFDDCRM